MGFYIQIIIAFLLVVFPACLKLKSDRGKPHYRELFISALCGAIFSLIISFNSHKSASESGLIAKQNDSLYKDLLRKNLQSAGKIIDSLDTAVTASRFVLAKSMDILHEQNKAAMLLNAQLQASADTRFELSRNNSLFNDLKVSMEIHYPINAGVLQNKEGIVTKTTADLFDYVTRREKAQFFIVPFDSFMDYRETKDGNATLYYSNDTLNLYKIVITNPDFSNKKGYESFIQPPLSLKINFNKIMYSGAGAGFYNENTPDLIMTVGTNADNSPKVVCHKVELDYKKNIVRLWLTAYLVKALDTHQIKSAIDLNSATLRLYDFTPQNVKYDKIQIDYGEEYASTIEINASKISNGYYKFPDKDVEKVKPKWLRKY